MAICVSGTTYLDHDIWAAGRMVAQSYSSDTYYLHAGVLGSDRQITDYTGAVQNDWIYYPWQDWTHWGIAVDAHFAGFQQSEGPNYGTPTRSYSGGQGRWLSPDPESAGANPANPQSWNAYSYAGNNPTTLTDPSGLGPCTIENFGAGGCWGGPALTLGGGNCMMNGVTVPCGIAEGELASGFAAECPGGVCSGFRTDAQGNAAFVNFYAFEGGGSGYLSASDIANGINVVNGSVMNDAQYNAYIQATYSGDITAQRQELAAAIAANSNGAIPYQKAYDSLNRAGGYLQGGNYTFTTSLTPYSLTGCGGDPRCNGIHFPGQTPNGGYYVHLDTANPFSGNPFDLLEHGLVDVFLGNTVFSGGFIPRPFP